MRILIVAPYTVSDITMAAVRLFEIAAAAGHKVTFVSTDRTPVSVYPEYDRAVVPSHKLLRKPVVGLDIVFWFDFHDSWLHALPAGVQHVLMFGQHRFSEGNVRHLAVSHLLAYPTDGLHEFMTVAMCRRKIPTVMPLAVVTPFKAAYRPLRRDGLRWPAGLTQVLVTCDLKTQIRREGWLVATLKMMSAVAGVSIRFVPRRAMSRPARHDLHNWQDRCEGLHVLDCRMSVPERLRIAGISDLLVDLSCFASHGAEVWAYLALGLPVLCLDIPPLNKIVRPGVTGSLLPATTAVGEFGNFDVLEVARVSDELRHLVDAPGVLPSLLTNVAACRDEFMATPSHVEATQLLLRI